jgi:hypothetical protein
MPSVLSAECINERSRTTTTPEDIRVLELLAHVDYLDESIERLVTRLETGSALLPKIAGWWTRFPERQR